jgi:hypothetical protein
MYFLFDFVMGGLSRFPCLSIYLLVNLNITPASSFCYLPSDSERLGTLPVITIVSRPMTAKTLIKNVTSNSNPSPNKRPTTAKMSNARKGKTTIPAIIRIGNLTLLFITLYSPLIGLQHQFKRRARALREHPSSNSLLTFF